jgi:hypothetical protein
MWRMLHGRVTPRHSSIFLFWRGWSHRGMQAMSGELLQVGVNPVFPGFRHVRLQALRSRLLPWEERTAS